MANAVVAAAPLPAAPAAVAPEGKRVPAAEASPSIDVAPDVQGEGEPPIFDEIAESAFLADARERGELVVAAAPPVASAEMEETDSKALPKLEELMKRVPAEVLESLEDLFRARFVSVRRIPKRWLKTDVTADGR